MFGSYGEWPNGAWANGIVPENYFRLFTATGPAWDDTDNILEFHSAPVLTEIDVPPASWALRGMSAPLVNNYEAEDADTSKTLKIATEETTPPVAASISRNSDNDITGTSATNGYNGGFSNNTNYWLYNENTISLEAYTLSTKQPDTSKNITVRRADFSDRINGAPLSLIHI